MAKWQLFKHDHTPEAGAVVVIGMGRFGTSVAAELMEMGSDVLAIDTSPDVIARLDGKVTHAVVADASNEEVLRQLAVPEMDHAVIAIGDSVENSILVASLLLGFGIQDIWAKAVSEQHGRILRQLGIQHIVHPEKEMGHRVAHLLRGTLDDFVALGHGVVVVEASPPAEATGSPVGELDIPGNFGVRVLWAKSGNEAWREVTPATVLQPGDKVLVTGTKAKAEAFHQRA